MLNTSISIGVYVTPPSSQSKNCQYVQCLYITSPTSPSKHWIDGLCLSRTLCVFPLDLNSEGEGGTGIWKLVNYIKDVEKERGQLCG